MKKVNLFSLLVVWVMLIAGCSSSPDVSKGDAPGMVDLNNPKLSELSKSRIYFGHQSVGMNIMDGVQEMSDQSEVLNINIVDFGPKAPIDEMKDFTSENVNSDKGFFAHGGVGKNGQPLTKLRDFEKQIDEGFGGNLDVALFKFCYKDFNDKTDIEGVFKEYDDMVTRLNNKYPELVVLHVTSPLRNPRPYTWKNKLKLLFDVKSFAEYEFNLARASYNKMVIDAYGDKAPVFDLAGLEATRPDGSKETFVKNNKTYERIYPDYTYDGGHLTPLGRKVLTSGLLSELIKL